MRSIYLPPFTCLPSYSPNSTVGEPSLHLCFHHSVALLQRAMADGLRRRQKQATTTGLHHHRWLMPAFFTSWNASATGPFCPCGEAPCTRPTSSSETRSYGGTERGLSILGTILTLRQARAASWPRRFVAPCLFSPLQAGRRTRSLRERRQPLLLRPQKP